MLVAKAKTSTAEPKMAFNFARTCKSCIYAVRRLRRRSARRLPLWGACSLRRPCVWRAARAPVLGGLPAPKNCHIFDAFVPHTRTTTLQSVCRRSQKESAKEIDYEYAGCARALTDSSLSYAQLRGHSLRTVTGFVSRAGLRPSANGVAITFHPGKNAIIREIRVCDVVALLRAQRPVFWPPHVVEQAVAVDLTAVRTVG